MRLVSFSTDQAPTRLGALLADDTILDLPTYWRSTYSGQAPAQATDLLRAGSDALARARDLVDQAEAARASGASLPVVASADATWQPPLLPPRIFGIGLNYRSHAEEQGAKIPRNPIVFTKALSSLTGHLQPIVYPLDTQALDYEAELAVVIGKRCTDVPIDAAMRYVAGYTCLNDVTARDVQRSDRQWYRSKSYPTFAPMGRELVTIDEAPPLDQLNVSCFVGDEQRQSSPITDLIFGVPELISFLSGFTTLEAGDVIATGTPSGVGFVLDPPALLSPGDEVTVEIKGISVLRNTVARQTAG